jgi:lysophospholipase L1-like esterase
VAQVLVAMVVALSVWAFADSPTLLRSAIGAPLGTRRSAAIDVLRPLARVDAALGLDRVEAGLADAVGRHPLPAATSSDAPPPSRPAGGGAAGRGAAGGAVSGHGGAGGAGSSGTAGRGGGVGGSRVLAGGPGGSLDLAGGPGGSLEPAADPLPGATGGGSGRSAGAPPPTTEPPLRAGTASDPIRVLVVGDSLAADLGSRLAARLDATGRITTFLDTRPATGLTRPDAFDWPTQLQTDLSHFRPDVVVAMWGANDAQGMPLTPAPAAFGSPLWLSTYAARVAAVLDAVRSTGARLLWVGEPVMRSATFDARMRQLDGVVEATLSGRAGVIFSDTRAVLATPSGAYADALPDASGELQLVRATDGIHLTWTGSDRLAAYEVAQLAPWLGPSD